VVADLPHDPLREVVGIGPLDEAMPEKIAMSMKMDGIERNFLDERGQFLFVIRLHAQNFLQFAAADERK
jgi:hypothetical protein